MGLDSLMYQSNWQVSFECNSERLSLFTSQVVKWYLIQYTELELCHHLACKLDKTLRLYCIPGHLLQLNGTKLYDRFIKVEPANTQMGGRRSKVSIPSMFPSSYVMPIPQLANYPYGMNQYSNNMKGRRNRQFPQGPNEIVTVPEDKILQLIDVGVNLPNKA